MNRFRAINLRGFAETAWLELRRINLLVGSRHSGKSSLIRLFPVLRQSVERQCFAAETKSPLVWDRGRVDYGPFKSVIHHGAHEVRLGFEVALEPVRGSASLIKPSASGFGLYEGCVQIMLSLAPRVDGTTWLSGMHIHAAGKDIEIVLNQRGWVLRCTIGGHDLTHLMCSLRVSERACIVPSFDEDSDGATTYGCQVSGVVPASNAGWTRSIQQLPTLMMSTRDAMEPYFRDEAARYDRNSLVSSLPFGTEEELKQYLELDAMSRYVRVRDLLADSNKFSYIHALVLGQNLSGLLVEIDRALAQASHGVQYFGPRHAMFERWSQGNEIAAAEPGHVDANLASSLLSLETDRRVSLVAIEQPEQGLWPEMQARIVDRIVDLTRKLNAEYDGKAPPILLEIDNPALAQQIGKVIASSGLPEGAAQMFRFEKRSASIDIRTGYLNKQGHWAI